VEYTHKHTHTHTHAQHARTYRAVHDSPDLRDPVSEEVGVQGMDDWDATTHSRFVIKTIEKCISIV
jgi:hypothetical protein